MFSQTFIYFIVGASEQIISLNILLVLICMTFPSYQIHCSLGRLWLQYHCLKSTCHPHLPFLPEIPVQMVWEFFSPFNPRREPQTL